MDTVSRSSREAGFTGLLRLLVILLFGVSMAGCVGMPAGRNVMSGSLTVGDGEIVKDDVNIFSGDLVVGQGGAIDGDVRVFSGDAVVDGKVDGDLMVFSGDVRLNGHVGGDLAAFAGSVTLGPDARIDGDLTTVSSQPTIDPAAEVAGSVTQGMPAPGKMMRLPRPRPLSRLVNLLASMLVMAVVAAILYSMVPAQVDRAAATAARQAWVAGGVGFATLAVSIPVIVVLAITICGIPVALIGVLALVLANLFGSTALGRIVADWLEPRIDRPLSPVAATATGAATLSAALGIIGAIPCLGWLIQLAVSSIGLGATVLTVFGRRDYPGGPFGPSAPASVAPTGGWEPPAVDPPMPDPSPMPEPDAPEPSAEAPTSDAPAMPEPPLPGSVGPA
ncbi:MAG: polymer-forming cytoskeletal protein [Chloroflexi bacterium]|nr:polymer-forming cytoskeletal protein [Chloroflexota bacterium]